LGDLFDTSHPTPQQLARVMRVFKTKSAASSWPEVVLLAGNHDIVSDQPGDHALGPLFLSGNGVLGSARDPFVLDRLGPDVESNEASTLCIPFATGSSAAAFKAAVARYGSGVVVAAAHFGIMDVDTPAFLQKSLDAVPVEDAAGILQGAGIKYLFVGNWHNFDTWQFQQGTATTYIVQVGALVPTGFDNPGKNYGVVAIVDDTESSAPRFHRLSGPRFFNATIPELKDTSWVSANLLPENRNYVRVTCAPKTFPTAQALCAQLQEAKVIAAFELRADREADMRAAESAAAITSNQTTIADAVAAYCSKAAFPPEVNRTEVLTLVQRFLTE
jgi:DNA repair exonuclease SbcCD nuclease subunit